MPKENRKRGRRAEQKRKRGEEESGKDEGLASKRHRFQNEEENDDLVFDTAGEQFHEEARPYGEPGAMPFYGLLDEDEQEYFKRADAMLELNQFASSDERSLFLANVYKEASGKELKIANSQSCSRLMERLILLSTTSQLKMLFQKFSGHLLHLVQHRFASHCCEALFLHAAPMVTQELLASQVEPSTEDKEVYVSMENLFLYTLNELEGNVGYLMTDRFASHPLRVLLLVLSGMPLATANSSSLLQSKKKENVTVTGENMRNNEGTTESRVVPASFSAALDKLIASAVTGLDTSSLRALAIHPIANPVLQLLLELELKRSGKQSAKDKDSLFRRLLPDDPLDQNTESISFINGLIYDTVGSRLLEVIVNHAPGKIFRALYTCYFGERLGTLAKNDIAVFVVIRIIERLNQDDLQNARDQICSQINNLVKQSRTAVIKTLIERCRVRGIETQKIADELQNAYDGEVSGRLTRMLYVSDRSTHNMAEDRRKMLEGEDNAKVHTSLLAQCMLQAPGPLRELIVDSLMAMQTSDLLNLAKDRTASRVLQLTLTCSEQSSKISRALIPQFYGHISDLAVDSVASHVIDAFWQSSSGLTFLKERVAGELAQNESAIRSSIPGRAVWRNWKMDTFKTRRKDWLNESKGQNNLTKTGIELARERFAAGKGSGQRKSLNNKKQLGAGANGVTQRSTTIQGKA